MVHVTLYISYVYGEPWPSFIFAAEEKESVAVFGKIPKFVYFCVYVLGYQATFKF